MPLAPPHFTYVSCGPLYTVEQLNSEGNLQFLFDLCVCSAFLQPGCPLSFQCAAAANTLGLDQTKPSRKKTATDPVILGIPTTQVITQILLIWDIPLVHWLFIGTNVGMWIRGRFYIAWLKQALLYWIPVVNSDHHHNDNNSDLGESGQAWFAWAVLAQLAVDPQPLLPQLVWGHIDYGLCAAALAHG